MGWEGMVKTGLMRYLLPSAVDGGDIMRAKERYRPPARRGKYEKIDEQKH